MKKVITNNLCSTRQWPMPKQRKLMRGHIYLDFWLSLAVLGVAALFTFNGLANDRLLDLIVGSVGVLLILLLGLQFVLRQITTLGTLRIIDDFPFGIFLVIGVLIGEMFVIFGFYLGLRSVIFCSPLGAILGGTITGTLAIRLNGRLSRIDELLADYAGIVLLLLLPFYLLLALAPSVVSELFSSGLAEGVKNTFAVLSVIAVLTGLFLVTHWVMQHYQNLGSVMAWALRFLKFCLLVVTPILLLSVIFYTGLGGPEDKLNSYLTTEAVILIVLFGLYQYKKRSS